MARTQDYFDFLVENIDIAPTNSQEEVDAAQLIANVFDAHGLEPTIQEFEAPENSSLFQGIAMVLLFLGLFLSGIGGAGLTAFGILLAAAGAALLIMRYLGNDVLGAYGPVAKSQNVIGFHEATGSLAAKGNRPIVIVAHYDTPREDLFWIPALAPYMGLLKQACVVCVPLVAGVALFQALGFLPEIFRRVLWLIGLIASLPVLLWGVTIIARRFMGCTPGANNNKAGVAAMLGILDKVRPAEDGVAVTTRPRRTRETIASRIAGTVSEVVRHGKEVLESLSILPESTEIEYIEPEAPESTNVEPEELLATGVIDADA
ncbi:MAG: hypothetical protein IJH87_00725, partial [Atopobiaceae bacterium]|nr:hypothetical protein [Atopobiaceae bacterium]